MKSDPLIVWGVGSPRTFRVHWLLIEIGLEYETMRYLPRSPETQTPEFVKLSPRRKVPVLQHGALVLTETGAILNYVADAFPVPDRLYAPANLIERAKVSEWCYFAMTELDANSLYVIRKHKELKHIYGEAPVAVDAATDYFLQSIDAILSRIERANPFLLSSKLSTADILLAGCLDWATALGLCLPQAASRYLETLRARPAFKQALGRNTNP